MIGSMPEYKNSIRGSLSILMGNLLISIPQLLLLKKVVLISPTANDYLYPLKFNYLSMNIQNIYAYMNKFLR